METLKSFLTEFSVFKNPDGNDDTNFDDKGQDDTQFDDNQQRRPNANFDDDQYSNNQDDDQDDDQDQTCNWNCSCPFCKALKDKLGIDPSDLSNLKLLVVDVKDDDNDEEGNDNKPSDDDYTMNFNMDDDDNDDDEDFTQNGNQPRNPDETQDYEIF